MFKLVLSLAFSSVVLTSCDWFKGSSTSSSTEPAITKVEAAIAAYNNHDLDKYLSFFDPNINVFHTNGLGTARIATGMKDFKGYSGGVFKAKKGNIKIIAKFYAQPWVFTHQKNQLGKQLVESTVGYRIEKDKIADMMIVGERVVD